MTFTLAFDVYGTLINPHGIVTELQKNIGDEAQAFSQLWRDKQLEYSFRRGLMNEYTDFGECTVQALNYAAKYLNITLGPKTKQEIIDKYGTLPAFADVSEGLEKLRRYGHKLYAFSNGKASAVESLLVHANLLDYFSDIISADEIKTFKPNPAIYDHFLKRSKCKIDSAWLVSSNPFDVIGAVNFGMRAAWIQRSPDAVFDPWGIEPTVTSTNIINLSDQLN